MSHHFSGPDLTFPHGDGRLDIADLFAFPKPGDSSRSILILDVHPMASATGSAFAPEAVYEFLIDTDRDATANLALRARFSQLRAGVQTATLSRVEGPAAARRGDGGDLILANAPVSFGAEPRVTVAGDYRFFAGLRSDPFFADVAGLRNGFKFTGSDSLATADVLSIALDLPNHALGGGSAIGLWCRVLVPAPEPASGATRWLQIDRAGHPEMVNFYCQGADKTAYNESEPVEDRARFRDTFAHALEHVGHYSPAEARAVADAMLPDILPYDPTRPAAYPENGRALTDDVWDWAVSRLVQAQLGDGVGPHADLLPAFPYLGTPHLTPLSPAMQAIVRAAEGGRLPSPA